MTSSHHGPYVLGYTHATMVGTMGCEIARWSQSHKAGLSWDCRLKPACMNAESLVTAGQHTAVNTNPTKHTQHTTARCNRHCSTCVAQDIRAMMT